MESQESVHGLQVLAVSWSGSIKSHHLLEFINRDGVTTRHLIASSKVNKKSVLMDELADHGYPGVADDKIFEQVYNYVRTAKPDERITLSNVAGFIGSSYLLANGDVIGATDTYGPMLNPELRIHAPSIDYSGDLESWQETIALFCPHSHILTLAICASLSGTFIKFTDIETGGFHAYGDSSIGKTTLFIVAASPFGGESFIQSWSVTVTGLEEIAAGRNHSAMLLNELKVLDEDPKKAAKKAQNIVYKLTEGQGKSRSKVFQNDGLNWRLSVLSCGEKSLSEHAMDGGNEQLAGERVRIIDVPADANKGLGIFHSLPEGIKSSEEAVHKLVAACKAHHGLAGRELIRKMCDRLASDPDFINNKLNELMEKFVRKHCHESTDGQQLRICRRFALSYASGIFASQWGILPLTKAEVMNAISICYENSIAEMQPRLEDRIQDVRSTVLNFAQKRLKCKYADKFDLKFGCLKREVKGIEVLAIMNSKMEKLVPNKILRTKLTDQLARQGYLVISSDRNIPTRQLPYKTSDGEKVMERFYCIPTDKVAA